MKLDCPKKKQPHFKPNFNKNGGPERVPGYSVKK